MEKLLNIDKEKYIYFEQIISNEKDNRYIVFLHGLMSDMKGKKASYIKEFCQKNKINFLSFDNLGHGNSSGEFLEQDISSWLFTLEVIYEKLLTNNKIILVGSSMGAWLAMLFAIRNPKSLSSLVLLAPAIDFTEEIWNSLDITARNKICDEGYIKIPGKKCEEGIDISYQLILDGRKHLLLQQDSIKINIPIAIIHGMDDLEVDPAQSMKILHKTSSNQILLQYIKNASHNLSETLDLEIIEKSLLMLLTK